MIPNQELVDLLKANINTGTGGMASPQDVEEFIDLSREQTEVLQNIRIETGIQNELILHSMELSEPAMVAAVEATAPDAADVVAPALTPHSIVPKEVLAAFDVTFEFLRRNIRRESANEDLNRLFAKRWGKDIVKLIFSGDTTLAATTRTNKLLRILDGFLKRLDADAAVHDVVVAGTDYLGTIFKQMLEALPKDYRDDRTMLAYFVSQNVYDAYEDQVGGRPTSFGDQTLFGNSANRIPYKRVRIIPVFDMPDDQQILTPMSNLVVGFGERMEVGQDIYNRKRLVEVTITGSLDCNYVVSDAVVLRKTS